MDGNKGWEREAHSCIEDRGSEGLGWGSEKCTTQTPPPQIYTYSITEDITRLLPQVNMGQRVLRASPCISAVGGLQTSIHPFQSPVHVEGVGYREGCVRDRRIGRGRGRGNS